MNYSALNPQALTWLRNLQPRIFANVAIKIATKGKVAQHVISWCIEHDIIAQNSLNLPDVKFDRVLLENIEKVQRQLNQACFRDDFANKSRLDSSLDSDQELKTLGLTPRDSRVLVRLATTQIIPRKISVQIIDINWRQLELNQFDALLVVENLDCFYQLDKFIFLQNYAEILVIYRGDRIYSKGVKSLKAAWLKNNKPLIYFGDFDPKGVSIALNEDYSFLLVPEFNILNKHASAAMFPNEQLSFVTQIQQYNISSVFHPFLQLLCQQLKGLRQQKMQGLELIPIVLLE